MRTIVVLALFVAFPGCGPDPFARARSRQLDQEIRELLVPTGCNDVKDCAALAVGKKACGGPRWFAVTCTTTTDMTTLDQLRLDVAAADNAARGVSDCGLLTAPTVALCAGSCVAAVDQSGTCR